jgi:4-hydroxy 2-oxovalerate aldolase
MVKYSITPIESILPVEKSKIKNLRIIFKKHENIEALKYCKQVKDKGYNIFINITFCNQYDDFELAELIKKINDIKPYAVTITDSMGVYTPQDVKRIYEIVENELDSQIALCFHSHNNLQFSFLNAKTLIESNKQRELIVDSTLYGMGRGAGNLNTEILIEYLNKSGLDYNLDVILKTIDKYILPIYEKTPWGSTIPYFLSAINKCHPNYAKDLIEKNVEYKKMDEILASIPEDKKSIYDSSIIL